MNQAQPSEPAGESIDRALNLFARHIGVAIRADDIAVHKEGIKIAMSMADEAKVILRKSIEAYARNETRRVLSRLVEQKDFYLWSHASGQDVKEAVPLSAVTKELEGL